LAVNVGSDDWNFQVKELAYAVKEVVPEVEICTNKDAEPDKRSYRVDFSLFKRLAPDHQPNVDLRSTIEELRDGLQNVGFTDTNFHNSRFMRLKVLTHLRETGMLSEKLEWN